MSGIAFGHRCETGDESEQCANLYCPYCDGHRVKLRDTLSTLEKDDRIIIVKKVVCRECGEASYAIRVFESDPGSYECVRRQDLEPRTGIRIGRGMAMRGRGCQWHRRDRESVLRPRGRARIPTE